jgi:hypothetical protein
MSFGRTTGATLPDGELGRAGCDRVFHSGAGSGASAGAAGCGSMGVASAGADSAGEPALPPSIAGVASSARQRGGCAIDSARGGTQAGAALADGAGFSLTHAGGSFAGTAAGFRALAISQAASTAPSAIEPQ